MDDSARILSRRIGDGSLKKALEKDDFWWYYTLPAGAFMGELLRIHAKGIWKESPEGGLEMKIPLTEGEATTYPFDKVLKQAGSGQEGDLYAYIKSACRLDAIAQEQFAKSPASDESKAV